jgi:hypothetical protein
MVAKRTDGGELMKALELIKTFSEDSYRSDYTTAKAKGTCILCGRLAKEFRNPSARLEYHVSALCQDCQDSYFMGIKGI